MKNNTNAQKDAERLTLLTKISYRLMPSLPYHNFAHAIDVFTNVNTLAYVEGIDYQNRFLLRTASLLHDTLYKVGVKNNEEVSAKVARKILPNLPGNLKYTPEETKSVEKLIIATIPTREPQDVLEKLMKDADLYNLGGEEFFVAGENLRREFGLPLNTWNERQLGFLRSHRFYTNAANTLRGPGKQRNIEHLEEMLLVEAI